MFTVPQHLTHTRRAAAARKHSRSAAQRRSRPAASSAARAATGRATALHRRTSGSRATAALARFPRAAQTRTTCQLTGEHRHSWSRVYSRLFFGMMQDSNFRLWLAKALLSRGPDYRPLQRTRLCTQEQHLHRHWSLCQDGLSRQRLLWHPGWRQRRRRA